MSAIAGRASVLGLYRQMIKASKSFNSYNFREYAVRRTREEFRTNRALQDQAKLEKVITKARTDLEVIRRQSLLSRLYVKDKSIVET